MTITMNLEWVRRFCLALPGATEQVQWGDNLVFKVAGKMFCVARLEEAGESTVVGFKVSDEEFAELVERPGIVPAPYLARAKWISLESYAALRKAEYERLIAGSYELVVAKMPKSKRPPGARVG